MKKLTVRERIFVNLYLYDEKLKGKGSRCAIAAGFSEKCAKEMAYRLLTRGHIQAYIAKRLKQMEEKIGANREYVLKKLKLAADRALPDDINETLEEYDPRVGISALSEINKVQGFYAKTDNSNNEKVDEEIKTEVSKLEEDA